LSLGNSLRDVGFRTMNAVHRAVLRLSGGRALNRLLGMVTIELHTTGRKSGQRRTTMLTAPIYGDERVVLVASKGGDDRHPDWYRNLVAKPEIEITPVGGETRSMRARTATAEEKEQLWPDIVAAYKGYAGYQRGTDRDIPVIICEPV
jgi:deazaflavin-dependent oxidoreductase (nitroreductase family)